MRRPVAELHDLVRENDQLHPFIWKTAEGSHLALHKIEDDHLKNILTHIVNNGRSISKAIRAEARRRGFTVPAERPQALIAAPTYGWLDEEDL